MGRPLFGGSCLLALTITLALAPLGCGGTSGEGGGGSSGMGGSGGAGGGTGDERALAFMVAHGEDGISEPIPFNVPENTRSMTVVIQGPEDQLYALGSLRTADGVEHVGIPLDHSYGDDLHNRYSVDENGFAPGNFTQSIRLGTFTSTYPNRPGQALPSGPSQITFLSSTSVGETTVTILMPAENGANKLHLNVISVSESFAFQEPPLFLPDLQAIFQPAGIEVVLDDVLVFSGTGFSTISSFTEPMESPTTPSTQLARYGTTHVDSLALNVFIVDSFNGAAGISLGIPGPPIPESYYYGVVAQRVAGNLGMARIVAHEVAHFLGLWHPESQDLRGAIHPDPLDDTSDAQSNLMNVGTVITPDQAYALKRSPLLRTE